MNRAARNAAPATRSVFGSASSSKAAAVDEVVSSHMAAVPGETCEKMSLANMIGYTGQYRHTLQFHPKQSDVIVFAVGKVIVISNLADPHSQRFLRDHTNDVCALAISPSGRLLVTGQMAASPQLSSRETSICLWNFESGSLLGRFGQMSVRVRSVSFSDDERWLAAATDNNAMTVWELSTGDLVSCAKDVNISNMVFGDRQLCPKSRRNPSYTLYTCIQSAAQIHRFDYDIKTMQYDLKSRRCDAPGRGALIRSFTCCALDTTKHYLLAGSTAGDISTFNVEIGQFRGSFPVCSAGIHSLIIIGNVMCVGGGDGTISKFNGSEQNWRCVEKIELDGAVTSLSASADGCELIAGTATGRIYRCRMLEKLESLLVYRSPTKPVVGVSFGAQRSSMFATISQKGVIMVWDMSDYTIMSSIQGPCEGTIICYSTTQNGSDNDLLSGWADGGIRSHSIKSSSLTWEIPHAVRGKVTAIAQTKALLVTAGSTSGAVRIWDRSTRAMISEYLAHTSTPVSALLLDVKRSNIIHSCGADRRRVSYNFKDNVYLIGNQIDNGVFISMAQRRTGETETVTAISDGRIIVWDIDLRSPVFVYSSPDKQAVLSVDVSPTGRYIVAAHNNNQVVVYSFSPEGQLRLVCDMLVHSGTIRCVKWTPDERQIVSVGDDCCICVVNFVGAPIIAQK